MINHKIKAESELLDSVNQTHRNFDKAGVHALLAIHEQLRIANILALSQHQDQNIARKALAKIVERDGCDLDRLQTDFLNSLELPPEDKQFTMKDTVKLVVEETYDDDRLHELIQEGLKTQYDRSVDAVQVISFENTSVEAYLYDGENISSAVEWASKHNCRSSLFYPWEEGLPEIHIYAPSGDGGSVLCYAQPGTFLVRIPKSHLSAIEQWWMVRQ